MNFGIKSNLLQEWRDLSCDLRKKKISPGRIFANKHIFLFGLSRILVYFDLYVRPLESKKSRKSKNCSLHVLLKDWKHLSFLLRFTLKHEIKATWKQGDMKLRWHEIKADFCFRTKWGMELRRSRPIRLNFMSPWFHVTNGNFVGVARNVKNANLCHLKNLRNMKSRRHEIKADWSRPP